MGNHRITPDHFDAVLFDLDGVLTSTARIHSRCWKTMFDAFLGRRATAGREPFRPFDIETDYKLYVDGKPRYAGVRSFLASRNISLAEGTPKDLPTADTVCGLGNWKDELVKAAIDREEVEPYPGSVALIRRLREQGIRTAVVSSSNNCEEALRAAGMLFERALDMRAGTLDRQVLWETPAGAGGKLGTESRSSCAGWPPGSPPPGRQFRLTRPQAPSAPPFVRITSR